MSSESPGGSDWIREGTGSSPACLWSFSTEEQLTAMLLAREAGIVVLGDCSGNVYRLDRQGRVAAATCLPDYVRSLAWSDDGRFGAVICGEQTVCLLNQVLQTQWTLDLPEPPLTVAMAPFGGQLLVTFADGSNRIYDVARKRLATFETIRPLAFAEFISSEPGIVASAEHGLIGRYQMNGQPAWEDKLWSSVGDLALSGDGNLIYLASFSHGAQVYSGNGDTVGSYMPEGTVNHVAVSYEPHRMIVSTQERSLYWLDSAGEIVWQAVTPDDVRSVACDPLGEWAICGLKCGRITCLDWAKRGV